jgi:hypothetical protein
MNKYIFVSKQPDLISLPSNPKIKERKSASKSAEKKKTKEEVQIRTFVSSSVMHTVACPLVEFLSGSKLLNFSHIEFENSTKSIDLSVHLNPME